MSSVQNFDRDMQYIAPGDPEVAASIVAPVTPAIIPTPATMVKNAAQIQHSGQAVSVPVGNTGLVGIVCEPPLASSRRVYRIRGFGLVLGGSVEVGLFCGYTPNAGGNVTVEYSVPIKSGMDSNYFDETVCVSSGLIANPPTATNENVCFYLRFWNLGAAVVDGTLLWQLSVQDLGTAPPEYDAARR